MIQLRKAFSGQTVNALRSKMQTWCEQCRRTSLASLCFQPLLCEKLISCGKIYRPWQNWHLMQSKQRDKAPTELSHLENHVLSVRFNSFQTFSNRLFIWKVVLTEFIILGSVSNTFHGLQLCRNLYSYTNSNRLFYSALYYCVLHGGQENSWSAREPRHQNRFPIKR